MKTGPLTLNSWKEIAAYLDRGVRTVQRWERELEMPVHRIGKGKRSPVYATSTELNFWMAITAARRAQPPKMQPMPKQTPAGRRNGEAIKESRRLLSTVHALAQTIAESSVRQRKQAEILQARILEIRSRIK